MHYLLPVPTVRQCWPSLTSGRSSAVRPLCGSDAAAVLKGSWSHCVDGVRQRWRGQRGAVGEGVHGDAQQALGQRHGREGLAAEKGSDADGDHAARYGDQLQRDAVGESTVLDGRDGGRDDQQKQRAAAAEGVAGNHLEGWWQQYCRESAAATEGEGFDGCDGTGYADGDQPAALGAVGQVTEISFHRGYSIKKH